MTGSALKNLDMFLRLCGDESLKNVMLLTTKWDKSPEHARKHEKELIKNFWADMIELGSSHPKRLGKVVDRASEIVDPVSDVIAPMLQFQPTFLQIQRELGSGKDLIDTAAGQYVDQYLSVAIQKYKESHDSTLAQAEKSGQLRVKEALAGQAVKHEEELQEAQKDKAALKDDFENVVKAEDKRRSKLFGHGTLSRLVKQMTGLEVKDGDVYTIGLASIGLFKACTYLLNKDGKSEDVIKSANDVMASLGTDDRT